MLKKWAEQQNFKRLNKHALLSVLAELKDKGQDKDTSKHFIQLDWSVLFLSTVNC